MEDNRFNRERHNDWFNFVKKTIIVIGAFTAIGGGFSIGDHIFHNHENHLEEMKLPTTLIYQEVRDLIDTTKTYLIPIEDTALLNRVAQASRLK